MCRQLDWQIDCAAQICGALMPALPGVDKLKLQFYDRTMPTEWQNAGGFNKGSPATTRTAPIVIKRMKPYYKFSNFIMDSKHIIYYHCLTPPIGAGRPGCGCCPFRIATLAARIAARRSMFAGGSGYGNIASIDSSTARARRGLCLDWRRGGARISWNRGYRR
ncbi:hypothetical protein EDB92DRAFT_111937 [Lactarius akahatsu]|uniref:Uncharacterized protein n=1 Tax=Lactarius akahatsu TaxID=416441 RepID=A0AAD4LPU1_9AGAM|nr:hypothetical protein EDB92DRAFT_111937 [Lactarius akahatsu]